MVVYSRVKLTRRQFLTAGTLGIAATVLAQTVPQEIMPTRLLRIALLHLAPLPGALVHNRRLVETAVATAAGLGARWIITPELCICGYSFAEEIGTAWITTQPDAWMSAFCQLVARLQVAVFLSHPERDPQTGKLYNSVFVIGANGAIIGKHRKINTLRVGAESWSTAGTEAVPIPIPPVGRVGILICADAYSPAIARSLRSQGAELLVSSAAWAPGLYGPHGEWERCTQDTGLPLLVCNRTGVDPSLNFTEAESVVVKDGRRLLSIQSRRSCVVTIEWNLQTQNLATLQYHKTELAD